MKMKKSHKKMNKDTMAQKDQGRNHTKTHIEKITDTQNEGSQQPE